MHASMGAIQLQRLSELRAHRVMIAVQFLAQLPSRSVERLIAHQDVGLGDILRLPLEVELDSTKALFDRFAEFGISARHGVDQLAHRQLGLPDDAFRNALRAFRSTVSLPFYPALTENEVESLVSAIGAVLT